MFRRKTKRILSLVVAATMAVTALTGAMTVSAETVAEGNCGSKVTWTLDSDGVLTISGEGAMASPNVKDLEPVEPQLGDYSSTYTYKEYAKDIKEVVIEEGVTAIGFCAFYKMPKLETVILPSTIIEFKGVGFQAGAAEPSDANHIDCYVSYTFAECTSLKNLTLTEGMTAIGGYAFYGCTSLESVRIPSTIKYDGIGLGGDNSYFQNWGVFSFYQCSSLKNITLPEGLTMVGAYAFAETAVKSIVIPSTVKFWHTYSPTRGNDFNAAFDNCKKLSSVTFTDGLKRIAWSPFNNCPSLKKVAIPASVTSLYHAFEYCTALEEAYIEDGAQITSNYFNGAFAYCTNLKKLEIPEGIAVAYTNPQWCTKSSSLTDIYLHGKDYTMYIPDGGGTPNFHCYFDTKTYDALISKNNLSEDQLVNIEEEIPPYLEMVKTNVDKAKTYDEELYTPESYAVLKALIEKAEKFDENSSILNMEWTVSDITSAIKKLEKKPEETSSDPSDEISEPSSDDLSEPSSDPVSGDSSNNPSDDQTQPTSNTVYTTATPATKAPATTAAPKATTANNKAVQAAKDKSAAEKVMKQAKITKLTAKAKGKKKIVVSWKKVSKAKGYDVQVSNKKTFKKILVDKTTSKVKLTIKSNKIKSKKTYYVRVRAYATYTDANGKTQKVYSSWIKKVRKVKVK